MTTKHAVSKLSLVTSTSTGTTVDAPSVTGTDIIVVYNTMPGNQPSTCSNTVFLYQADAAIPYNQKPQASQAVPTNSQSGSMDFSGLQVQNKPYIIGYATGPDVTQICSWVLVPAGMGPNTTFQTSISVPPGGIQPDVVLVSYDTPVGNQPQSAGQWLGIWQGSAPSYTVTPLSKVAIGNNNATSQIGLPVTLLRGTSYCIGYFMGPKQTTLAASFNFST
ncbi:hypothetical protein GNF76_08245 [Pseudomonas sp. CCM 7893]|uniref:Uncharacterized protein n=1 Tax=Pseudomonas spelaei TaxID=1055469 RepID=A0A6I3WA19_9PSED|nr:hypothetical protein [Pseudomonas spelaei]MUF04323.1 hypothetical protein [Pseudomonas spelaei]